MRTYQKHTVLSTMSPLPRISCRLPAKPLGREEPFPAVVRKSAHKVLILQDSAPEIEKFSRLSRGGREIRGVHRTGEGRTGRRDLVSPPRLRYISPSVGGV
jgi:hypothetical protein